MEMSLPCMTKRNASDVLQPQHFQSDPRYDGSMASSGGDGNGGSGDEDGVGFGLGLGLGLGYGSDSSVHEAHLIRHIDRTILACQICRKRFRDPKVSRQARCETFITSNKYLV